MKIENLFKIENKIAVVTGGSRGIGEMITAGFLANGVKVYISARKAPALIDKAKELSDKYQNECIPIPCDLSSMEGIKDFVEVLKENEDGIDFLINNAATGINKNSLKLTSKHWDWVMNTNSKSPWILSKNLSEIMPKNSSIINITSLGSQRVLSNYFSVGLSKSSLESMTRYLAIELGEKGIKVNSVSPGIIKTSALDSFPEDSDVNKSKLYETPAGKPLEGEDVSNLVNFLCSPDSNMIRGQNIIIDGGRSLTI